MGVSVVRKGNMDNIERLLKKRPFRYKDVVSILQKYGEMGVELLAASTPVRTGVTAQSWGYKIIQTQNGYSLYWTNSNIGEVPGRYTVNIAVILDKGHASRDGSWVEGYHFIEPALEPVFNNIAESIWKEVTSR